MLLKVLLLGADIFAFIALESSVWNPLDPLVAASFAVWGLEPFT